MTPLPIQHNLRIGRSTDEITGREERVSGRVLQKASFQETGSTHREVRTQGLGLGAQRAAQLKSVPAQPGPQSRKGETEVILGQQMVWIRHSPGREGLQRAGSGLPL